MSYVKSMKLSPFKTVTLTLGKLPDGSIWQNAFITQEGVATSLSVDCPSSATKAERKGFFSLVKEALRRAQSIEELTGILKPPAPLVEPILPGVVEEDITGLPDLSRRTPWTAEQEMVAHETTLKGKLLCLLQTQGERHTTVIEAVLGSGLLPQPLLELWLRQQARAEHGFNRGGVTLTLCL